MFSFLFTLRRLSECVVMIYPSLAIQLTCCCTYVAFQFFLIVFAFYRMLKYSSVMVTCSYKLGPARWGTMAEWHGEKNLQVSRARSWDFMARFTPSAILQVGGGFVNPLLNASATGFSSCSLSFPRRGNLAWRKSREPRFWHLYYTRR